MSAPTNDKIKPADINAVGKPLIANLKSAERALQSIRTKSAWHAARYATLAPQHAELTEGLGRLKNFVGSDKSDPDFLAYQKSAADFLAGLKSAVAQQVDVSYYFGAKDVKTQAALITEVKKVLPTADENHAAQAVTDAANGTGAKDAAVAGKGVKHASAGVKAKNTSCTVFFTHETLDEGKEQRMTVVAVGSHRGASSYVIHDKLTSKLVAGKTYSL